MKRSLKERAIGGLTITRIIQETQPLRVAEGGSNTIGMAIDEMLQSAAARGHQIQTITLDLEPDRWEELAVDVYGGYVERDSEF